MDFLMLVVLSSVARCLHFFDRSSRVRPGSRSLFLASHLGGPNFNFNGIVRRVVSCSEIFDFDTNFAKIACRVTGAFGICRAGKPGSETVQKTWLENIH
jgi:hypothetical protein